MMAAIDDALAFSPWRGLVAHRPLGFVMRARNQIYTKSVEFRGKHNGFPIHEPQAAMDLKKLSDSSHLGGTINCTTPARAS